MNLLAAEVSIVVQRLQGERQMKMEEKMFVGWILDSQKTLLWSVWKDDEWTYSRLWYWLQEFFMHGSGNISGNSC